MNPHNKIVKRYKTICIYKGDQTKVREARYISSDYCNTQYIDQYRMHNPIV
jgi:hypothetical protein